MCRRGLKKTCTEQDTGWLAFEQAVAGFCRAASRKLARPEEPRHN
jgi:hypothetical protein